MAFLMKSQKLQLAGVLQENDYNPADFDVLETTARGTRIKGETLRLKGTDSFFGIYPHRSDWDHEKFLVEYSPGEENVRELHLCADFVSVLYKFAEYLSFLRREENATDPWGDSGVARVTKRKKGQTLIPAGHHFTGQRLARAIMSEAITSLDILDPYVGPELFDRIDDSGINVPVRILTSPKSNSSSSYYLAFKKGYAKVELRLLQEAKLHDRFIILDKSMGYHLGHSVKDLGKKDTQLSPIDDIRPLLLLFEERWLEANPVT